MRATWGCEDQATTGTQRSVVETPSGYWGGNREEVWVTAQKRDGGQRKASIAATAALWHRSGQGKGWSNRSEAASLREHVVPLSLPLRRCTRP